LRWGSHQDNADDAVLHEVLPRGENHPNATLTAAKAKAILDADKSVSNVELARSLDVSVACVSSVRRGKTWRHVA
jgi:hypothetical protein